VWEYVRQTSGIAAERKIDEWLPPGLGTLAGWVWFVSLVVFVVLLVLPGKRLNARQLVLLAVFLPLSCSSVRMIAWWLLVTTPILAFLAADRLTKARETQAASSASPNLGAGI